MLTNPLNTIDKFPKVLPIQANVVRHNQWSYSRGQGAPISANEDWQFDKRILSIWGIACKRY